MRLGSGAGADPVDNEHDPAADADGAMELGAGAGADFVDISISEDDETAGKRFTADELAVWDGAQQHTSVSERMPKLLFYLNHMQGRSTVEDAALHYLFLIDVDPTEEDPGNLERLFREQRLQSTM
jgi:hypothetical protein